MATAAAAGLPTLPAVRRATWPTMATVAHQPLTEPSVDAGKRLHYIHSMGNHDALKTLHTLDWGCGESFIYGSKKLLLKCKFQRTSINFKYVDLALLQGNLLISLANGSIEYHTTVR